MEIDNLNIYPDHFSLIINEILNGPGASNYSLIESIIRENEYLIYIHLKNEIGKELMGFNILMIVSELDFDNDNLYTTKEKRFLSEFVFIVYCVTRNWSFTATANLMSLTNELKIKTYE